MHSARRARLHRGDRISGKGTRVPSVARLCRAKEGRTAYVFGPGYGNHCYLKKECGGLKPHTQRRYSRRGAIWTITAIIATAANHQVTPPWPEGLLCSLGVMYTKGRGVKQDHKEAVEWYRTAAKQGFAPAQFNLGVMCANG